MLQHLGHARMPTQHAFSLLRACVAPQAGYIKRTTPPDVSADMLAAFDRGVIGVAATKLELSEDERTPAVEATLAAPFRAGGLGLRRHADTAHLAYFACAAPASVERSLTRLRLLQPVRHYNPCAMRRPWRMPRLY